MGWRLLYSPPAVLDGAKFAFLGLNPGGDHQSFDQGEFATPTGSAYATETWNGSLPGQSILQRQVLALFQMLGVTPESVLAGNLVPFRSPAWESLSDRGEALAFGKAIWRDILQSAKPTTVVGMGNVVNTALKEMLQVRQTTRIPLNWGNVSGERGAFAGGKFVGLPHLSRFQIATRPASRQGLQLLLRD